jgi:hypothetical protein
MAVGVVVADGLRRVDRRRLGVVGVEQVARVPASQRRIATLPVRAALGFVRRRRVVARDDRRATPPVAVPASGAGLADQTWGRGQRA